MSLCPINATHLKFHLEDKVEVGDIPYARTWMITFPQYLFSLSLDVLIHLFVFCEDHNLHTFLSAYGYDHSKISNVFHSSDIFFIWKLPPLPLCFMEEMHNWYENSLQNVFGALPCNPSTVLPE